MSLTQDDLQQIRTIVEDAFEPLRNEINALRNDMKEIYRMMAELKSSAITNEEFKKRSLEEKLLTLNAELLATAKQAGITLPRN